ncbi:MAG TPA: crossover junction endodeoxyribonuclease RuvC [Nitrospinota bacterium]|nr:crossover junction endodeoxyribonuclease RuvC [Nitrospinota bacterium]
MPKEQLKIIGINPGTRYLGVAVFQGSELMDWRVKVLKGKWSKEKMKRAVEIISEFIDRYEPGALAIKKLHPSRRSRNLAQLTAKIKEFSRRKGLKVFQYSIKEVEEFFIKEDKLNKKNMAEAIVLENPALFHELQKEKAHKNPYFIRVFEAVALTSVCFYQLDK